MLVLISSTSFSFSMHFCMGKLKNMAVLQDASRCAMETDPAPCSNHTHSFSAKSCCEDHSLLMEAQDELTQQANVSVPAIPVAVVMHALVLSFPQLSSSYNNSFTEYSPPLIERDIPVFIHSFLI